MGFLQPCTAMAAEQIESGEGVKYITAFEALPEEDTCFPCMYKPDLEELLDIFPETLLVQVQDEEDIVELEVTWECEEDFDHTELELYIFYPQWDESLYEIAESEEENIEIPSIMVEVPLDSVAISDLQEAKSSLQDISAGKSILALIYLCDEYDVKESPSYDSENIITVVSGQSVQITDVEMDEDGFIWYKVTLFQNEKEYTGYVEKEYLATADENLAEWEAAYIAMPEAAVMTLSMGYPDVDQFPASYQNALYALKDKHPNWVFVRMDTGIDWNKAITSELGDKSLVYSSSSGSWQNGTYGQGWSYASEGILKYYMDPRNFLTDPAIFQFEQLTYNSSYHTTSAVQEILKNSFMSSGTLENGQSYAQSFTNIGQSLGISPFHLASRVLQEQGTRGTSSIISGTYPGYEGYYNYFNVGASGKTDEAVIVSGLKTAIQYGWNTRYKSLYGGASIVGANYILRGQDTLYLEKFNVSNGRYANFTHQYMQNIQAPSSEASSIRKAYNSAGALENSFVFKIPVYNNMPASACSKPETTDVITLDKTTIDNLEVNKSVTLTPYINGSKVDHVNNMSFTSDNTLAATVDSQGKVTAISPGTAVISCTRSGANTAKCTITVIKANPDVSTPVLSPVTYREGLKLSDVTLPEGWVWAKNNTEVKVGTASYPAVYTPSDTTKYNTVTKDISFTVTKAIPSCRVPDDLEAKTGEMLGNISLPSGFVWESNTETELNQPGEYTFYVSYNPDENNYYTVNHIPIIVQVVGDTSEPSGDGQTGTDTGTGGDSDNGSGNISSGSTGTSSGSTVTSSGSTGSSGGSTVTSSGSTSTSGESTNTSVGSTGTSGGITGTSSGSTVTSSGSTGTSTGSTVISSDNTTTSGDSTGTSSGSTTISTGSTVTSNGNTNTSAESTETSGGSAVTSSNSNNASSENAGAPMDNGSAPAGSKTTPENNNSAQTDAPSVSSSGTNTSTDNTSVATGNIDASTGSAGAAAVNVTTAAETGGNSTDGFAGEDSQTAADGEIFFKPSVTIQMEDTTMLTEEMLQTAKEQNFNLILEMGDYAAWDIDIDSVNMETLTTIDMGVVLGTDNIPQELITTISGINKYIQLTLSHDGSFGFDPVLRIALDPAYCGRYANLFYHDAEAETLAFICASIIGADGVASFHMDHASDYVIIISGQPMTGVLVSASADNDDVSDEHSTSRIIWPVFIILLLAAIGGGSFFYLKKKREADAEENDEDEKDREIKKHDGEKHIKTIKQKKEEIYDSKDTDDEGYLDEEYDQDEIDIEELEENEAGDSEEPIKEVLRVKTEEPGSEEEELEELEEIEEIEESDEEDDWIDEEDWQEPESEVSDEKPADELSDDHEEDDWIDDDEWDIGNDWIEDDEWEKKNGDKHKSDNPEKKEK